MRGPLYKRAVLFGVPKRDPTLEGEAFAVLEFRVLGPGSAV